MPDYKKLYFELFNSISDMIDKLKEVQLEAEENYINSDVDASTSETP